MLRRRQGTATILMLALTGTCGSLSAATLHVPQDYQVIQEAIDAASAGDTVLVSPGTYKERIRMKPGVTLKSTGKDGQGTLGLKRAEATIINGQGQAGQGPGVAMAEGSTLDGLTITHVGLYDDAKWKKHHATQGEHQPHEHIGHFGTPGVGIEGVNCTVTNNIVHHNGSTGIAIRGITGKPSAPRVAGNICYRNMGGGIGSMEGSTATIEANVCFQNFYAGIGHDGASPLVMNNRCYENIRAGIGISEGARPIVRGNKCYQNRRAGIGIRSGAATRPLVEDNDCYENDMAGIGTRDKAAPTIRNNRCYQNKLAGIGSRSGATPLIIGNQCYQNGTVGIGQFGDARTVLMGNDCHHNKKAGIGFESCKSGHSTVVNNRVIDNALVAVGIHTGWTVHLSGNELARSGGLPPIVMVFEGAQASLTDNVIRGGGVAGIRAAGQVRAVNNRFEGTALRRTGPPNFAIWALKGSQVLMLGNRVRNWRHALHASQADVSVVNNAVRQFHGAAFVIQQPAVAADVYGNTAWSADAKAQVVRLDGLAGVIADNHLKPPADSDASSAQR